MSKVYFISDLHLGHRNIPKYREQYGDQFKTLESHNEFIISQIQKTVGHRDTLWILGDTCFTKETLPLLNEINCVKHLILGNHCTERLHISEYLKYFKDIHGMFKHKSGMWLTHAPIHPDQLRGRFNIHGHIHSDKLSIQSWKYFNCSGENINFKPIELEEIREKIWNNFLLSNQDILTETNILIQDILIHNGFTIHKVNKMLNKNLSLPEVNHESK